MKLDELYADAAKLFVSTNRAAGMVWYAGMSEDEVAQTVASFAGNPGFQAALGRVLAFLSAEAGTEKWTLEIRPDGDHLVRRIDTMEPSVIVSAYTKLGQGVLDLLGLNMAAACIDPATITRYKLVCQLQANDMPIVQTDGVIELRWEKVAGDEPAPRG